MKTCPQCAAQFDDSVGFCNQDGTALTGGAATGGATPKAAGPAPGDIFGAYRLGELLGEGGMGYVYLAEHIRLGRQVALKLLRAEYAVNPEAVKRFFGEARAVNQINHENIVEITDFVEDQGNDKFYIMELLRGSTLTQAQQREGALELDRVLHIAIQVTAALAAVHDAGIIHRDLKPDNIFLTERAGKTDWVKLLDFGVAKLMDVAEGKPLDETAAGALLGTPEYMSPEQASGRPIDARTDIYSFGVILYELVTGKKPLVANSLGEMIMKHLTVVPPSPSKLKALPYVIPPALETLIVECLEKEPEKRPGSMRELGERLAKIRAARTGTSSSSGSDSRPAWSPKKPGIRLQRRQLVAGAAGAVLLVVLILLAAIVGGGSDADVDEPATADSDNRVTAADVDADLDNTDADTDPDTDTETGTDEPTPIDTEEIPFEILDEVDSVASAGPAVSDRVVVSFVSVPPGAAVFRVGNPKPLGLTPFAMRTKRSASAQSFEFRLTGHAAEKRRVTLQKNARLAVTLVKRDGSADSSATRPPVPAETGKRDTRRRAKKKRKQRTLDPFAND